MIDNLWVYSILLSSQPIRKNIYLFQITLAPTASPSALINDYGEILNLVRMFVKQICQISYVNLIFVHVIDHQCSTDFFSFFGVYGLVEFDILELKLETHN